MSESKTHFRKVYKSDHLGVADLEEFQEEGVTLEFTIKEVRQEIGVPVAGKKGNYNIAYFQEKIKPLVLNVTNAKIVRSFCKDSPWVDDWKNIRVSLYVDASVKMKGSVVGGVRIHEVQPRVKKVFTEKEFEAAKNANATIDSIQKNWDVSPLIAKKYNEYVKTT